MEGESRTLSLSLMVIPPVTETPAAAEELDRGRALADPPLTWPPAVEEEGALGATGSRGRSRGGSRTSLLERSIFGG
jgi:hypothetical protein